MRRAKRHKPRDTAKLVLARLCNLPAGAEGSQQHGRRASRGQRAAPQAMQESSDADSDSTAASGSDASWLPPGAMHVCRQAAQQSNAAMKPAGPSGASDTNGYCPPAAHEALEGTGGQRQAPPVRHRHRSILQSLYGHHRMQQDPAVLHALMQHALWLLLWSLRHAWQPLCGLAAVPYSGVAPDQYADTLYLQPVQ